LDEKNVANLNETYHERIKRGKYCPSDGTTPVCTQGGCKIVVFTFFDNDMDQYRKLTHLPLEKIQCPSLIIHGTHDTDVKFYDGVYAYEHIPSCERYWIEEGSHLGFWLSPHAQEAQKATRDFLAKHCPELI